MRFSFLCILSLFLLQVNAQTQFGPQQVISTEAQLPVAIELADVDNDGFVDVLSAARASNNLAWYKNIQNTGQFEILSSVIDDDENFRLAVADLDNDGDMDVVSTSVSFNHVFWVENLDGNGNFSSIKIIDNLPGAFDVTVGDIDGDGLTDIVAASISSQLIWYKNLGSTFNDGIQISEFETNGRSVSLVDIDSDGDLDILNSNSGNVIVNWYENLDGEGSFSAVNPIDTAAPASSTLSVFGADFDGDMDIDLVVASAGDTAISWYENLDGQGAFGDPQTISNSSASHRIIHVEDLDNDGDKDVLAGTVDPDKIIWFANDGNGNFGPEQIITAAIIFPRDIKTADLDGDGDMDVLSVSQNDNKIAWYENFTILSNETETLPRVSVTPNPVSDTLQISITNGVIDKLQLFNVLGEQVLSKTSNTNQIDVRSLKTGIYFLQVSVDKQILVKKIIKR